MVNRVNGNDYYDYKKLSMPTSADTTSAGEKFSLDYQRADARKEKEEEKEKISGEELGKNLSENGSRADLQSGVRLELSGEGQEKAATEQEGMLSGLFGTVRSFLSSFAQSFKALLFRIWYDPVPKEEVLSSEEVPVEETDRLSEEYLELNAPELQKVENDASVTEEHNLAAGSSEGSDNTKISERNGEGNLSDLTGRMLSGRVARDREIQKHLRSGNLDQVISLLTEDGQRTIAKNSSLLTYYDRTGRLTSISASDQERILHGDRNVKKL